MIRLGILGSTRGTNMLAIIEAIKQKQLDAEITVVVSNKPDAMILSRAAEHGLPAEFVSSKDLSRADYDRKLALTLQQYPVDLIVLTGYMRILSPEFVAAWQNKIINVHPSLLPAFAGLMDLEVHRAALTSGTKESGCTVHYVTNDVDAGPILLQKKCAVLASDTPESLKARVQELEGQALVEVIRYYHTINPGHHCQNATEC